MFILMSKINLNLKNKVETSHKTMPSNKSYDRSHTHARTCVHAHTHTRTHTRSHRHQKGGQKQFPDQILKLCPTQSCSYLKFWPYHCIHLLGSCWTFALS